MKERVGKGIVNMLIFAVPSVSVLLGKPEMNNRLIVDVNIDIKAVWEHMMGVVFVAPPSRAES